MRDACTFLVEDRRLGPAHDYTGLDDRLPPLSPEGAIRSRRLTFYWLPSPSLGCPLTRSLTWHGSP